MNRAARGGSPAVKVLFSTALLLWVLVLGLSLLSILTDAKSLNETDIRECPVVHHSMYPELYTKSLNSGKSVSTTREFGFFPLGFRCDFFIGEELVGSNATPAWERTATLGTSTVLLAVATIVLVKSAKRRQETAT